MACATVFPSDTIISMRLPDSASIFTAEIRAVNKALKQNNILHIHSPSFKIYEAGTSLDWDGDISGFFMGTQPYWH